jgi:hypothetical protein
LRISTLQNKKEKPQNSTPSPDFSQVKKIIDKERKKGSLFDT